MTTALAHERAVTPGAPGPNQLKVDVALLANAQSDLRDLRLYDADNREVGYILVPPAPKHTWFPGVMLPIGTAKNTSGFELDLGEPRFVDRVRFDGIAPPFLKRVTLEGSGDRSHWTSLAEATVFDVPAENHRQTEVEFKAGTYRYVRATWDDRTSARVSPASASVHAVRFEAGEDAFSVAFPRRTSEPRKSRYRLILPGTHLPITAIEIVGNDKQVFRNATVTEPRLGENQIAPVVLGAGTLRTGSLRIPIASPEGRELDLAIEDGNNPPLDITTVYAELSPQPWIYFESRDGAPLRARYGNANARTPLYDLEASRPGVEKRHVAYAEWGPASTIAKTETKGVEIPRGGEIARDQFRVSRKIPSAPAGLAVLLLDAHVLSRSNDLADVRIADADGRQVPYLVEDRAEPLAVKLAVPARTASGRSSTYRLELPYDTWPNGTRLVLTTNARVFDRDVLVRRVPDTHRNRRAEALAQSPWRTSDPELPPPAFEVTFGVRDARAIEVVIDEGDNAPLPITSATLLLPSRALRFHHPGTPLSLLYGNRRATAPRYDIQLLAGRLFGEPARELTLSQAVDDRGDDEDVSGRKWFWVGIIIAAVVLIAMLLRLVLVSGETSRAPGDST